MPITALAAYILLVFTASGALLNSGEDRSTVPRGHSAAAGMFAVVSAMALPWSGIPMSRYFGAGSWLWFPAAAMSLLLQSDDGMKFRVARRVTAACNIGAIVAAICVFMLNMGIPGDIPSIEGISAITALDSIRDAKIICAFALFFVSAVMSFACAFNPACPSRASRLLSFSCSSFLALALVPPAHVFLRDFTPRSALFMDMAFYFLEAETLHFIVFKELYQPIVSKWRYSFVTVNAAFTLAGIYFLFSIAKN